MAGNFIIVLAVGCCFGGPRFGGAVLVNSRNVPCLGTLPFTFTRVASEKGIRILLNYCNLGK